MKSPKDMKVIQIEITNACPNRCANCTRFCGHHQKPFFMDFETFKKAVDSMKGFPGIVGIMGGEPTLHPEFDKFVRYFKNNFGQDEPPNRIYKGPDSGFVDYICKNKFNIDNNNQRGLWSSMGHRYYKFFELIQDTFGYQALNDHSFPSMHETLMVTRKELGIPDEEWYSLRDKCWIQSLWSASITPKGAFFCEVAAALDMLFNGPGGWPIESDWWKREPSEFGDQLRWCELCSAPLPMPKRDANKEIDDASPVWCEMLKKIQSPKYQKGKVSLFDPTRYDPKKYSIINESLPYLDDQSKRLVNGNGGLEPKKISIWFDFRNTEQKDFEELIQNNQFYAPIDAYLIRTDDQKAYLITQSIPESIIFNPELDSIGTLELAEKTSCSDFIIILDNYKLRGDPREVITQFVYNPGCFYYRTGKKWSFSLFSIRASSLITNPTIDQLQLFYPKEKQVFLDNVPDQSVRIYQVCHQPSTWLKNEVFHPIHAGKKLSHVNLGISGDDSGDNISLKNREYAEITALYWMWKNDKTSSYIGLCHYRRLLIFNPEIISKTRDDRINIPRLTNESIKEYGWMPGSVLKFVLQSDIVVTRPWCKPMMGTQREHYRIMHGSDSLERLVEGVRIHAPDYYPYLIKYLDGKCLLTGHMFVMKRELLDQYCNWLFPLLEKIYPNNDFSGNSVYNIREPAFACERLFHLYIEKLKNDKPNLTISEVPWVMIEDTNPVINSLPALKNEKKVIPIVTAFDSNFVSVYSVHVESLISVISNKYHYDLIVLMDNDITDENKNILNSQISVKSNISIRFFKMGSLLTNENLKIDPPFARSTFFRLKLATILPEYEKVLYLDPDTIVLADPAMIFEQDIGDYYCAAVRCLNTMEPRLAGFGPGKLYGNISFQEYFEKEVGISRENLDNYFNAGVMVFNLNKMRKNFIEDELIRLFYLKNYHIVDQDILNKVFQGNVFILPQKWNLVILYRGRELAQLPFKFDQDYKNALKNPAIIHYAAPYNKPWLNEQVPYGELFWMFARKSPFYEIILKRYINECNAPTTDKSFHKFAKTYLPVTTLVREFLRGNIQTNVQIIKTHIMKTISK